MKLEALSSSKRIYLRDLCSNSVFSFGFLPGINVANVLNQVRSKISKDHIIINDEGELVEESRPFSEYFVRNLNLSNYF